MHICSSKIVSVILCQTLKMSFELELPSSNKNSVMDSDRDFQEQHPVNYLGAVVIK